SDVLQRLNPSTPVLATTATANARVTEDVAQQLGHGPGGFEESGASSSEEGATLVLRGALARASLELSVVDRLTPLERYAWVVDHLPKLAGSGIVYTLTVADAERLTEAVRAVHGDAVLVAAYTGQLEASAREGLEDALRRNELKALIATSALGMGYDKPDLGFVIHVGSPPSPVSYYQQVGRAGRAISHAHAVLLPSDADSGVWDYFATATIPVPEQVRRVLDVLGASGPSGPDGPAASAGSAEPMSVAAVEAQSGVRRGRVELMLKQLAVDSVVERVEGGWVATGKEWSYDAEHYDGVVAVRRREADIMRAYTRGEHCLMQLLQESLDDPTAEPCGRCSVCVGSLPADLSARPSDATVDAVTGVLRGQVHLLEPRKMWPGGAFGSRGRIAADEMPEIGRTLVFADAPEWRETIAAMFARDAAAPDDVLQACVRMLSSWRSSWAARPEVVVDLPAAGFPLLTGSVADHLASVGKLARASFAAAAAGGDGTASSDGGGAVSGEGRGPGGRSRLEELREMNSAEEAAFWRDRLHGGAADSVTESVAGRSVLLVVDATSSIWPITVASAVLRRAGASVVLPLLLHRRP
ncbi:MAG TPA: helicase-related protein, partial [Nocardioidaceae bacterium]|nr:helicase-related protein [Nocardioidaceae bacterium]